MNRIYLDNAATTPLLPEVIEAMKSAMEVNFANPSSIHAEGRSVRTVIERARKTVANSIKASVGEVFFTSGGTESNNMVLKNAVRDQGVNCIITSPIEHHCILHTVQRIEAEHEVELVFVETDKYGVVTTENLAKALEANKDKNVLISLMWANNEVGTINDIPKLAEVAAEYGALFHSDTVQAIGYFDIDVSKMPIHYIVGAAHKFHGPKGIGFVYINGEKQLKPMIDGGAQERNMRAGTENVYGIVGMAKALEMAMHETEERINKLEALNTYFRSQLNDANIEHRFNSPPVGKGLHPKVLSVAFPPSERSELLVLNMDISGVAISGGSACSSGIENASHVLAHLNPDDDWKSVRFSFSHKTTKVEIDKAISVLKTLLS